MPATSATTWTHLCLDTRRDSPLCAAVLFLQSQNPPSFFSLCRDRAHFLLLPSPLAQGNIKSNQTKQGNILAPCLHILLAL